MDLGDKIKSARSAKGMTQKELADKTGLSERTIQRIENHEVEPSGYSLSKISDVLEFDCTQEKLRIMKRNQVLYIILIIWTLALIFNVFFTSFDFASRWRELLIWAFTLISVATGQIYIPYRKKR
uniref:helix-turn-helix domain-containing protein n=1 Tax=Algoriphagus sp. TaxID=1872435 RepID=UPI00404899B2